MAVVEDEARAIDAQIYANLPRANAKYLASFFDKSEK